MVVGRNICHTNRMVPLWGRLALFQSIGLDAMWNMAYELVSDSGGSGHGAFLRPFRRPGSTWRWWQVGAFATPIAWSHWDDASLCFRFFGEFSG
jgi:hypothetical protein